MYTLPKQYLSYSAIDTWLHRPSEFRKRYYLGYSFPMTPELTFGKHISDLLENDDELVAHIERYDTPEKQIKTVIEDIPVFGYIDSFDSQTNAFLEYKTGKRPWTQARVNKHLQLDLYSLCIEEMFGEVHDETKLIWMQTENIEEEQPTGLITHEDSHSIRLTGETKVFTRTVTADERNDMRKLVMRVAKEISEDYTEWKKGQNKSGLLP